jgi:hypothetical protein
MDEYLFIAMAKLKADRLKLEREQRESARVPHPRDEDERRSTHRAWARWFNRAPEWREQS